MRKGGQQKRTPSMTMQQPVQSPAQITPTVLMRALADEYGVARRESTAELDALTATVAAATADLARLQGVLADHAEQLDGAGRRQAGLQDAIAGHVASA